MRHYMVYSPCYLVDGYTMLYLRRLRLVFQGNPMRAEADDEYCIIVHAYECSGYRSYFPVA